MRNFADTMNEDLNLGDLDRLARTNSNIAFKQLSVMQNSLRQCGNFFSFVNEAKITSIAERLQRQKIGARAVKVAVDRIIDNFEKFPSYKSIYELCRAAEGTKVEEIECNKCSSTGQISIYCKETGRNYGVSCDCQNGKQFTALTCINTLNLNKFTRIAPTRLGEGIDPYEGYKEKMQEFKKRIKK